MSEQEVLESDKSQFTKKQLFLELTGKYLYKGTKLVATGIYTTLGIGAFPFINNLPIPQDTIYFVHAAGEVSALAAALNLGVTAYAALNGEADDIGHDMRIASAKIALAAGIVLQGVFALRFGTKFDPLDVAFYGVGYLGLIALSSILRKPEDLSKQFMETTKLDLK